MSKLDNLTGKRFGEWTVLERLPNSDGNVVWKCRCSCGDESAVHASSLRRGQSTRCMRCRAAARRKL